MDGDYETSFLLDSLVLIPYADEKNDTIYVRTHRPANKQPADG